MANRILVRGFLLIFCLAALVSLLPLQPSSANSPDIVISQVYGGGGNTDGLYQNDYVELFNRSNIPVSIGGWSVQYASATGTGNFAYNPVTLLSGTIQAGQYYLVRMGGSTSCDGSPCGAPLPASDATGTVNMGNTGGKVALVTSTSGLACNGGSTPCSSGQLALIKDLVGWGLANFYETAAAPATNNTTAVFRKDYGCTDTDNNSADFTAAPPLPRNTSTAVHSCNALGVKTYIPLVVK